MRPLKGSSGGRTLVLRFVVVALAVLGTSCDNRVGVERLDDVGFVDVTGEDSSGLTDVAIGVGCSLLDLETCTAPICCDVPVERCVPGVLGENECQPAGERVAGERCGRLGPDDCASGLLCAGDPGSDELICRTICSSDAECPAGSSCSSTLVTVIEDVPVCNPY